MLIRIVTPAPRYSRHGNRVTALRWARILRDLGHRVIIEEEYRQGPCDAAIVLHARRSARSAVRLRQSHPESPLVVALTGTDLYRDVGRSPAARKSLAMADRIVVLQPRGLEELGSALRKKARVIFQSATPPERRLPPSIRSFDVCVLGHLRPVKDPFRAAAASRLLPASSRIKVLHAGEALTEAMAKRARSEEAMNPRYRWLGGLPAARARGVLARSRLLILTSRMEGGANVIMEALAAGVPILASRIAGTVGILGGSYPGYFPVGDERRLAAYLRRAETDDTYYARLVRACRLRKPLADPRRERRAWENLLAEILPASRPRRRAPRRRSHS